jgi:hypothetical protein
MLSVPFSLGRLFLSQPHVVAVTIPALRYLPPLKLFYIESNSRSNIHHLLAPGLQIKNDNAVVSSNTANTHEMNPAAAQPPAASCN